MDLERFVARQRTAVNVGSMIIFAVFSFIWATNLLEGAFDLGWRWDPQIRWFAPLMMVFTVILRFFFLAIFRIVVSIFNAR